MRKPELLDFIKQRNIAPQITKEDRLFAEMQHDEALARKRDVTGKEPTAEEAKVPEALVLERAKGRMDSLARARRNSNPKTIKRPRPSWER